MNVFVTSALDRMSGVKIPPILPYQNEPKIPIL
jgi:hypothetical protein